MVGIIVQVRTIVKVETQVAHITFTHFFNLTWVDFTSELNTRNVSTGATGMTAVAPEFSDTSQPYSYQGGQGGQNLPTIAEVTTKFPPGYIPEQLNYRMYQYDKFSAYCSAREIFEKQNCFVAHEKQNQAKVYKREAPFEIGESIDSVNPAPCSSITLIMLCNINSCTTY